MADQSQRDRLLKLANDAGLVAEICQRHGEATGASAARAQHRALLKEIEQLGRAG